MGKATELFKSQYTTRWNQKNVESLKSLTEYNALYDSLVGNKSKLSQDVKAKLKVLFPTDVFNAPSGEKLTIELEELYPKVDDLTRMNIDKLFSLRFAKRRHEVMLDEQDPDKTLNLDVGRLFQAIESEAKSRYEKASVTPERLKLVLLTFTKKGQDSQKFRSLISSTAANCKSINYTDLVVFKDAVFEFVVGLTGGIDNLIKSLNASIKVKLPQPTDEEFTLTGSKFTSPINVSDLDKILTSSSEEKEKILLDLLSQKEIFKSEETSEKEETAKAKSSEGFTLGEKLTDKKDTALAASTTTLNESKTDIQSTATTNNIFRLGEEGVLEDVKSTADSGKKIISAAKKSADFALQSGLNFENIFNGLNSVSLTDIPQLGELNAAFGELREALARSGVSGLGGDSITESITSNAINTGGETFATTEFNTENLNQYDASSSTLNQNLSTSSTQSSQNLSAISSSSESNVDSGLTVKSENVDQSVINQLSEVAKKYGLQFPGIGAIGKSGSKAGAKDSEEGFTVTSATPSMPNSTLKSEVEVEKKAASIPRKEGDNILNKGSEYSNSYAVSNQNQDLVGTQNAVQNYSFAERNSANQVLPGTQNTNTTQNVVVDLSPLETVLKQIKSILMMNSTKSTDGYA